MINLLHGERQCVRVSKTFSYRDRLDDNMIGWVMEHVSASPFTCELWLKDGESVRTTLNSDLSMTIDIQYKL